MSTGFNGNQGPMLPGQDASPQNTLPPDGGNQVDMSSLMTSFTDAYNQQQQPNQQQMPQQQMPQQQAPQVYEQLQPEQPQPQTQYTLPPMPEQQAQPQQPPFYSQQQPYQAPQPYQPQLGQYQAPQPQPQPQTPMLPQQERMPYLPPVDSPLPVDQPPQQMSPLMQQAQQMGVNLEGVQTDAQLLQQMSQALEMERQRTNQAAQMAFQSQPAAPTQQAEAPAPPPQQEQPFSLDSHLQQAWGLPQRDPVWDVWIQQGAVQRGADGIYQPAQGMEMLMGHPAFQNLNAYETAQRRIDQTQQLWSAVEKPIEQKINDTFEQLWQNRYVEEQNQQFLQQFEQDYSHVLNDPNQRQQFFDNAAQLEAAGMTNDRDVAMTSLKLMGINPEAQQAPQPNGYGQPPMMQQPVQQPMNQQLDPSIYGPPPIGMNEQQVPQVPPMMMQQPVQQPVQQPAYDPRQAFMQQAINSAGTSPNGAPTVYGQDISGGPLNQQQLENMFVDEYNRQTASGLGQAYNPAA